MDTLAGARANPAIAETSFDWEAAFAERLPQVYSFLRYRVGGIQLAEDLTSATFEKAWRHRCRFDPRRAQLSTWLLTIARNTAADHFRRRRRELGLHPSRSDHPIASPEDVCDRREERDRLLGLLRSLAARGREIVALKYGAGLTNRAIAGITVLSETNVGTLLHRTVVALRRGWEEQG
jgi:RNA polymerase sigma-70 factor (ECF subfamily)